MSSAAPIQLSIEWLVRARWGAVALQLGLLLSLGSGDDPLKLALLWSALGLMLLSNLWLRARAGAEHRHASAIEVAAIGQRLQNSTGGILTLDSLILSAWLATSGGTTNPFTILYLVQIVLSAVVLNARWTGWLTLLSVAGFAGLFLLPTSDCCVSPEAHVQGGLEHDEGYQDHMQGMWLAFTVAALLIGYLVRQISLAADRQRRRIEELQIQAERSKRLASLTTLATGAAHELRTPLATIAVASYELKLAAQRLGADALAADAELIEDEVSRCQSILQGMGLRLSENSQTEVLVDAQAILKQLVDDSQDRHLEQQGAPPLLRVQAIQQDLVSVLDGLVTNARQASTPDAPVRIWAERRGHLVDFCVEDQGTGMSSEQQRRAVEPFYTTKAVGQGLGLGLFIAHTFALSHGGELQLNSEATGGTRVTLSLPRVSEET